MRVHTLSIVTIVSMAATSAWAQAPAPAEPKIWAITASAGLALTSGNSNTSTVNAAYELTYDSQTRNVFKSDALFIRGKTEGEVTTSRFGLSVRDEYRVFDRAFVFAQNQYLRDEFKDIDFLLAPSGGIGVKVLDTAATKLSADAGVGGVWEKNTGVEVRSSGAITASEKLTQSLTTTATLTQNVAALWKMNDWDDSLYAFGIGISGALSARTQLKVEALDVYKSRPLLPTIKKNDVAVLMTIVYKI